MSEKGAPRSSALDLEVLELDPSPTFVIGTGESALDFAFIYCNKAFRHQDFKKRVEEQERQALLFRCWAQAIGSYKPYHDFAERRWYAQEAGKDLSWKIIRVVENLSGQEVVPVSSTPELEAAAKATNSNWTRVYRRSKDELLDIINGDKPAIGETIPRANLTTRWEGLQTMMEMSDVGVFEYNLEGKLIHANQAWYRLSSHPQNLPAHVDFSFMDLVYPDDQALVMSMWNTLAAGNPVTFEMRWKAPSGSDNPAQWVLSACVPLLDDEGTPISIAGNIIDINAQKKTQEVTQTRVEALERARVSEQKFARFAKLSPTAIYIFVPEQGKSSSIRPDCGLTSSRYELCQRSIFRAHGTLTWASERVQMVARPCCRRGSTQSRRRLVSHVSRRKIRRCTISTQKDMD